MTNANWRRERNTGSRSMISPPHAIVAARPRSPPSGRLSGARQGPRFQDVALQTLAGVREHRIEVSLCNRTADAERQTRLDCHSVGEPRLTRRVLLQLVVFRKRMHEGHGLPGHIERETAARLPAEEVFVDGGRRQPNRPGGSDPIGLVAGPNHLVDAVKPSGPGFSVLEDREDIDRPGSQLHGVLEAHGSSVEERGVDGVAWKTHGMPPHRLAEALLSTPSTTI